MRPVFADFVDERLNLFNAMCSLLPLHFEIVILSPIIANIPLVSQVFTAQSYDVWGQIILKFD